MNYRLHSSAKQNVGDVQYGLGRKFRCNVAFRSGHAARARTHKTQQSDAHARTRCILWPTSMEFGEIIVAQVVAFWFVSFVPLVAFLPSPAQKRIGRSDIRDARECTPILLLIERRRAEAAIPSAPRGPRAMECCRRAKTTKEGQREICVRSLLQPRFAFSGRFYMWPCHAQSCSRPRASLASSALHHIGSLIH